MPQVGPAFFLGDASQGGADIRYGDRPEKKAELYEKVDGVVDVDVIERLVAERKLTSEGMSASSVAEIREQMENR